jgi:hypothetical protein
MTIKPTAEQMKRAKRLFERIMKQRRASADSNVRALAVMFATCLRDTDAK